MKIIAMCLLLFPVLANACLFGDVNYPSSLSIDTRTLMVSISGHRDSYRGFATVHHNPFRTTYTLAGNIEIKVENSTYLTQVCIKGDCYTCR